MIPLKINRRLWGRGVTGGLLRSFTGKQCCLGFACRASGFKVSEIQGHGMLSDIDDLETLKKQAAVFPILGKLFKVDKHDLADNSKLAYDAAGINDDIMLSDKQREKKLTTLFKKHGVAIEFVG
jgi:hypothetical protein